MIEIVQTETEDPTKKVKEKRRKLEDFALKTIPISNANGCSLNLKFVKQGNVTSSL